MRARCCGGVPGASEQCVALKLDGAEQLSRIQTNWNPDDRRAPYALQKQAALLDTKPEVDLVAGPVRQLTASPVNNTWATTHDAKVLRLVGGKHGPLPRALQLSDFGRFSAGRFSVANPPHNAPMFRKRLMDTIGYFDQSLDPLSDWELWVRGIINGSVYWFLGSFPRYGYCGCCLHALNACAIHSASRRAAGGGVDEERSAVLRHARRQPRRRRRAGAGAQLRGVAASAVAERVHCRCGISRRRRADTRTRQPAWLRFHVARSAPASSATLPVPRPRCARVACVRGCAGRLHVLRP